MKQISDKITLIPIGNIRSQWQNTIDIKNMDKTYTFISTSPVVFSQESDESEAGLCYSVNLTAVCSKDKRIMEFNNRRIVAKIFLTDRSFRIIGTMEVPAHVVCTPHESGLYKVSITCKMLSPVLL